MWCSPAHRGWCYLMTIVGHRKATHLIKRDSHDFCKSSCIIDGQFAWVADVSIKSLWALISNGSGESHHCDPVALREKKDGLFKICHFRPLPFTSSFDDKDITTKIWTMVQKHGYFLKILYSHRLWRKRYRSREHAKQKKAPLGYHDGTEWG